MERARPDKTAVSSLKTGIRHEVSFKGGRNGKRGEGRGNGIFDKRTAEQGPNLKEMGVGRKTVYRFGRLDPVSTYKI